jgi:hypothetical protein
MRGRGPRAGAAMSLFELLLIGDFAAAYFTNYVKKLPGAPAIFNK